MTDYLVLVRLSPSKMQEAIGAVRNLPEKPISGVDLCYTMNIFGSWDLGVLIDAENTSQAQEFVQKKIKDIPGVTDVYTLPTFPHGNGTTFQKDIEPEEPTQNESGKKRQHRG